MVQTATRRDDHPVRRVAPPVVTGDRRTGQCPDAVDGPDDRTPERTVAVKSGGEGVVHHVTGVVVVHGDLFEDHTPLGLDVLGGDQRRRHHVADQVHRQRQVIVQHPRVVAGVFLVGEGVHLAADRVDGLGDVHRAALPGARETQVPQAVGRDLVAVRLVTRGAGTPGADLQRAP